MVKKKINIVIPTFNEAENITAMVEKITEIMAGELSAYAFNITFIDNDSDDGTQSLIQDICQREPSVRAIFNAHNFGHIRSPFYGLLQSDGDCTIVMAADFQDPPDMIPEFVKKWEEDYRIVIAVKNNSRENRLMYFFRSQYYKLIKRIADIEHVAHFTGFGLYDRAFIDVLRNLDDPYPYMRGLVAELGFRRAEIPFTQPRREKGITKNNFYTLYDMAMLGITSYSKIPLRLATICGFSVSIICLLIAFLYLVLKLLYWQAFPMGIAPLIISVFFIGGIQLFFIGLLGEYILNMNIRVMKRPLVVEDKRINFSTSKEGCNLNRKYM